MNLLRTRSPHLAAVLQRTLDEGGRAVCEVCFEAAQSNGGNFEWDFARAKNASYNPLPARIALIMINDGGVRSPHHIGAAMLASVALGTSEIAALTNVSRYSAITNILEQVEQHQSGARNCDPPIQSIVAALWLDRARHIHLIATPEKREVWVRFLADLAPALTRVSEAEGKLFILLRSWYERFSDRLQRSTNTREAE